MSKSINSQKMKKLFYALFLLFFILKTQAQQINFVKLDSLFQILETKDKYMGSIAIAQDGKIIYTKSIGKDNIESNKKSTENSKYRIGSISKMFTSTLIFKAIEENKLSLSQTIEGFFQNLENAKTITIGNLLNHKSGIHNFTNDEEYLKYNTQPKTESEMLAIIEKGKSDFTPNSKNEYSNSNYVLLSYILEKIYKKPFKSILEIKILKPLELKNTYFGGKTNLDKNENYSYDWEEKWIKQTETDMSIPMGAGAIVSNPIDLTIFIEKLFDGKIINQKSLAEMTTFEDKFGFGIFKVPFFDKTGFGHTGGIDGFSSSLSYFKEEKLAIALTSNGSVYGNNNIAIAVLSSYFGKPFSIPDFKELVLTSEELNPYLGEYSSPSFPLKIMITKENATLIAQATGQSSFPLTATKKDVFEFETAKIILEFKPSENQMTLNQNGRKFVLTRK
jgi:CubicO group peptidase (beta-lactamase class C family)